MTDGTRYARASSESVDLYLDARAIPIFQKSTKGKPGLGSGDWMSEFERPACRLRSLLRLNFILRFFFSHTLALRCRLGLFGVAQIGVFRFVGRHERLPPTTGEDEGGLEPRVSVLISWTHASSVNTSARRE